ncbi:MAG: hypothetical protein KGL99_01850 [Burkholderiales bacterium]|nr:hypothetical protein [Burkholderiales bacterium]MDE2299208.1 hypothetical protein [Burkholderiales bacterium]MDE2625874.1 hypothetical protein [Burkholderiales bacterium]
MNTAVPLTPHPASQIRPGCQRARCGMRAIGLRHAQPTTATASKKPHWRATRSQSIRIGARTPQIATSSTLA